MKNSKKDEKSGLASGTRGQATFFVATVLCLQI